MKLLVLFSAWASNSIDGHFWSNFYRDLLNNEFSSDHKVIVINCNSAPFVSEMFSGIRNTIGRFSAPPELAISSDASGYQVALQATKNSLKEYDVVLFAHAKGSSHSFSGNITLRDELHKTIFNRNRLVEAFADSRSKLVCHRGHLPQAPGSIDEIVRLCKLLNQPIAHFTMAATYTLYAVSAVRLQEVLEAAPIDLFTENLNNLSYNRYFFEGPFPSLLAHGVDKLEFLVGCELEPSFNKSMCADAYPRHNSFLCQRAFSQFCTDKINFKQFPTPYIFGPSEALTKLTIQYDP